MNAAWMASIVVETVCAAFAIRARRWWRVFAFYLCADIALSLGLLTINPRTRMYFLAYVACRVVTVVLLALVVHEAVTVESTRNRVASAMLSAGVRWRGMAVGLALAVGTTLLITPSTTWTQGHRSALAILRVGTVLLVGWLAAATATARIVPSPWKPAAKHRIWLLAYIGGNLIASVLMDITGPEGLRVINHGQQIWVALCYSTWPLMVAIPAKS